VGAEVGSNVGQEEVDTQPKTIAFPKLLVVLSAPIKSSLVGPFGNMLNELPKFKADA